MATTHRGASGAPTATVSFDRSGPDLTVYVAGEIDADSAPVIEAAILDHARAGDARLWMDLSDVTFCDSSGLVVLYLLHCKAEREGGRLVVYRPTPTVERVIHMCDLSRRLAIHH